MPFCCGGYEIRTRVTAVFIIFTFLLSSFEKGGNKRSFEQISYTTKGIHKMPFCCGGYEIRTHDLLHAMQAL